MRSKKDLQAIKEFLIARKHELEDYLKQMYAEKSDDGDVKDSADEANSSIFETLKSSLQHNELEEYKMINQALQKIDQGNYGMCADCQNPILAKRLKSYPNAARCVECQELQENGSFFD